MAVELEIPVRISGEPVVVAAVEHDRVIVGDALRREQSLELLLVDEVAPNRILQVGFPVQPDGILDVILVVRGRVLVDLDQDDLGIVEMLLDPIGRDEHGFAAHRVTSVSLGVARRNTR